MEIVEKPWGAEYILERNDRLVVKKLFIRKGHRVSLQYHQQKYEFFYVLSGLGKFTVGENQDNLEEKIVSAGFYASLIPYTIHRMQAIEDLTYLEATTPEDEIVRLDDDYKRI